MPLKDLIRDVKRRAPTDAPLDRLATAAERQRELADELDQLLDHFVREARDAGHSWTEIGDVLGVSKQAAQQRHRGGRGRGAGRGRGRGRFARFTPEARATVIAAQGAARELGHEAIDTEHVLLGLLDDPATPVAGLLVRWDVDRPAVEAVIAARSDAGGDVDGDAEERPRRSRRGHIPFTRTSKHVLEQAMHEARGLDHDHIDNGHILLGLLRTEGGNAARILTERGVTYGQAREAIADASPA